MLQFISLLKNLQPFVLVLLMHLFAVPFTFSQRKEIDKVVAQVGDNVILLSDIQSQKIQALQAGVELKPEFECEMLEELLYQELLINQAKLDSLVISDQQVDAEMENRIRMIENQIGSRQKMEEFYGKSITQIKDEFRNVIKDQLLSQEMERQITADISVSPKEVAAFFKTIPEDSIPLINSKLSFQQIVFYPEITKEDKKLAYNKLLEIRTAIMSGKSFETQARIHSMDPGSAPLGGKITASRGMMVPKFEATVFSLKPGEVSEIFETTYGYHIVKLIERKGDDYTCTHILIIPEFNTESLALGAAKIDSCYDMLRKNLITWNDAVIKFSNDGPTMHNKGIITNPITGEQNWSMEDLNQVDQQIYLLTNTLEVGQISSPSFYVDPMERKQGMRIVRLLERTEPHRANLKDDYTLIQRAAENDKKQKNIKKWVQGKIGNAYIRIDESFSSCTFKNQWIAK